ncbi:MAG: hypothetical protein AAGF97_00920 [Planctomycetota bacterium]
MRLRIGPDVSFDGITHTFAEQARINPIPQRHSFSIKRRQSLFLVDSSRCAADYE